MTNFKIDIVSDTVCPWCYIGKRHLESSIAAFRASPLSSPTDTFTTTWLPYYLNPSLPPGTSTPKHAHYISKFGPDRASQIFTTLSSAGRAVGITFCFGGKTGNTRDSHRLIALAKRKGGDVQDRVVDELFAAYFENEQDITSEAVLLNAGVAAGLEEAEVRKWLESGAGGEEVDGQVEETEGEVVSGVPHFRIHGYEISGAQGPRAFLSVFGKIKEDERAGAQQRL